MRETQLHQPTVPIAPDAFHVLTKQCMQPKGATKAYRKSQSLIFSTEAPQFVGAGEGADNLDFMADLSTLEVIDPGAKGSKERGGTLPGHIYSIADSLEL